MSDDIKVEWCEPTASAKSYDSDDLRASHCRWPVGLWRTVDRGSNLCCGCRVVEGSRYCSEHFSLSVNKSSKPYTPAVIPSSRRLNNAARGATRQGSGRFDNG